jgi:hypothetical protein
MRFNFINLLNNDIIELPFEGSEDVFIKVQIPTIETLNTDREMMVTSNLFLLKDSDLIRPDKNGKTDINRLDFINYFLDNSDQKELHIKKMKELIVNVEFKNQKLCIDGIPLTSKDLEEIKALLKLGFGSITFKEYSAQKMLQDDSELSPQEKRLLDLEKKLERKKEVQQEKPEESSGSYDNQMESVLISTMYEFRLTLKEVLNFNYYTLFWYYNYAIKVHGYRVQNYAIATGSVKSIKHFTQK